ncbi:MAG TPA: hypothetical protein VEK57_11210 [Thermoanaerobaculia bacterium]|nr:hypothetical protein [Thermoanaerobaculia bacterium]
MIRLVFLAVLLVALPLFAAPARPYHLELEATPQAVFPYLGRFGTVDLHVYAGGVRGEALWLHGFSRTGAPAVTVVNPLGRMYVDVQTAEIPSILTKLSGGKTTAERRTRPRLGPTMKGTVKGIAATRHRLLYGKTAWIDVWTTDVIPQNQQLRTLVNRVIGGVAPGTAAVADKLPGTPIYVEVNFRRFRKVAIVKLKKLTFAADDEEDALTLGRLYVRASVLENLWD